MASTTESPASPATLQTLHSYRGNCHCGSFKFTIKVPKLESVRTCDCSFCSRKAYKWIFPIADSNLVFTQGKVEDLAMYGEGYMVNYFCKKCGSAVMGKLNKGAKDRTLGINARLLSHTSLLHSTLQENPFKGSDLPPPYIPPEFPPHPSPITPEEEAQSMKVYNGHCFCKGVMYTLKTKDLGEREVISCNCSLCSRNGELYIYPPASSLTIHAGSDLLTTYPFVSKTSLHTFCQICGVSVLVRVLPELDRKDGKEEDPVCPVNVRNFVGVDLDALNVKKYDGWGKGKGKPYAVV